MAKTGDKLDRLRAGFDAALAVGQELDRLMREGAWVYHDVLGDNFNIDHVVVSPRGIFAIETKGALDRHGGIDTGDAVAAIAHGRRLLTIENLQPLRHVLTDPDDAARFEKYLKAL